MYKIYRRKTWIEILQIILTAFIAGATCFTAYLAYKSVQLSAAQDRRESRQEFMQLLTLLRETLESVNNLSEREASGASTGVNAARSTDTARPITDVFTD